MKIIILKRKNIIKYFSFVILLFLLFFVLYLFNTKKTSLQALYPLDISKNIQYDLNCDGNNDSLELVQSENKINVKIKLNSKDFFLANELPDKTLFTNSKTLKPNIFIHNNQRNNIPQIILMGSKNNIYTNYIFQWNKKNKKFDLLFNEPSNTLGILDCKNTKTPQFFSLDSLGGINTCKSFMLINNNLIDTTASNNPLPYDTIENFINLMQLPYELDELPNIFTNSINKDELALLWSLNKENYTYKLQNAFFYDYDWNDNNEPISIKYRLSFKQESLTKSPKEENELILLIDLAKTDTNYKITSIQKCK